jgi:hypothetical protein
LFSIVEARLARQTFPPTDTDAAAQLPGEQLVPPYLHFIDDHIVRPDSLGQRKLTLAFEQWRDRLVS